MKLEHLFIGGLTLGLVIVLGATFMTELLNSYQPYNPDIDLTAPDALNNIGDKTSEIYSEESSMRETLRGKSVTDDDAENEMFRGGYTATRSNPYTVRDIISNSTTIMQQQTASIIPSAIWKYGLAVLAVFISFGVLYLIFRIPNT